MIYFDDETCYECREMIDPDCRKKYVDEEENVTLYFCGNMCLTIFENHQRRLEEIERHRRCNYELGE